MSRRNIEPWSPVECRHHRGGGVAGPVIGLMTLVGLLAASGTIKPSGTAPPKPAAPAPPTPPPVRTIIKEIPRTVTVHPGLTGTEKVLISLVVCVAVVAVVALICRAARMIRG